MVRTKALGRGLASLIPTEGKIPASVETLPVGQLRPNPLQPRKKFDEENLDSLVESIRAHGIIQPILVRPIQDGFEIVAGERRWRAACKVPLEKVPVRILDVPEDKAVELALIENVQREDLAPLEVAQAIEELAERFSLTHEAIARELGWSRTAVTNKLRLLQLPDSVKALLEEGSLSEGHARALLSLKDPALMSRFAEKALRYRWTVRDLEEKVQEYGKKEAYVDPERRKNRPLFRETTEALERKYRLYIRFVEEKDRLRLSIKGLEEEQAKRLLSLLERHSEEVFASKE